jgi:hypothetical protein
MSSRFGAFTCRVAGRLASGDRSTRTIFRLMVNGRKQLGGSEVLSSYFSYMSFVRYTLHCLQPMI